MSSVSASSSSASGFDIEPIDSGDEVETGVEPEPEMTTRKLNSIKKLISEQDPLMDEEEIANLDFKSATDNFYNNDCSDWVTLDFKDSNKKYILNGNALNAQELVSWCMQHGKDVVKNFKQKQA